jgi:glycerophosphoryl diester phosphodiesterase
VQQQTRWHGPLIQAFMDRENPNPRVSSEDLGPFALLAPSIRMSNAFMAAASRLGKPLLSWIVDTPADLYRGLELGVNAVVSNSPLALRAVLMDWRDRCSDRQGV